MLLKLLHRCSLRTPTVQLRNLTLSHTISVCLFCKEETDCPLSTLSNIPHRSLVPSLTFVFLDPSLAFQRCLRRSERVSTPETWLASPGSYLILLKVYERTNADSEILNSVHLSGVVLCPLPGPTASDHPSQSPAQMESVSIISINSAVSISNLTMWAAKGFWCYLFARK